MARADLTFSPTALPRAVQHDGIAIREDVAFTNAKGNEKKQVRKVAESVLGKLAEPLRRCILRDEAVLYVCHARTPMSWLEQSTFRALAHSIASCVLVVTNKRLLVFRINPKGGWTKSMCEVPWANVLQVKVSGWLSGLLKLEYRSGKKECYWGISVRDKGKLKVLAPKLMEESRSEVSGTGEMHASCPECFGPLQPRVYECPRCGLAFKDEGQLYWRALIPGLCYLYTGHPILAVLDGLGETYALLLLFTGAAGVAQGTSGAATLLIAGAVVFAVDYVISLQHNLRFVREFLPTEERRNRVGPRMRAAA